MGRKRKIPKTPEQRLAECETHLYFLWLARQHYTNKPEHYKQIAAELRILVADRKPARRLLLAMMQEYGFTYDVQPPGPPFDKNPIPMVGWRDDLTQQAIVKELQAAEGDNEKMAAVLEKTASLRRPIPFDEYVEKGLAVWVEPYDYSYQDLVLAISQQIGSSHEDSAVEEPIIKMQHVLIGDHESHITTLIGFTDLVLKVGVSFIRYVSDQHGYEPSHFAEQPLE